MVQAWASKVRAGKGSKGDRLGIVDHSTINYPPFRKNFYIEVCCHLDHASGCHPPAFGTLRALHCNTQCFAQSWGSVVCVSPSLPSLGAGSFCLMHICLIATRAEPVTELMLHSTYCGSKPFQHTSACNTVCNSQCLLIVHCLLCSCLSPDTVQHMRYPVNAVSSICIPSVCKVHSCAGE